MREKFTFVMSLGVAAVAAVFVILGLTVSAAYAAGPWYVAPGGNDDSSCLAPSSACASIDGALAKPGFAAGDTVLVAEGTYTDTGPAVSILSQDVTVSGGWTSNFMARDGLSVLDGENARAVLFVSSGVTAEIHRLVIQNGMPRYAPGAAGGITNSGELVVEESTVRWNDRGGIGNYGTVVLNRTTVSENTGPSAGGIWHFFAIPRPMLFVNNSTISGNSGYQGGGIDVGASITKLSNSTIVYNSASFGGGGIANRTDGQLTLQNTIIAHNSARFGPDCFTTAPAVSVSHGYNILRTPTFCGFSPSVGDLFGADPLIRELTNNGGPTATHALLATSPAIDAGNPGGCTDHVGNLLASDQRGVTRPQGTACDIGAYELVQTLVVEIDCMPGSDVNPINLKKKGVIPVAILTTDAFDAMSVDHTTVMLDGESREAHVSKKTGEARRHVFDVDGDGDTDLLFHFQLGATSLGVSITEVTLTGETYEGVLIEGTDSVRIIR